MVDQLLITDRATWDDLATYISRAQRIDAGGGVRLQAVGSTLAAWVAVMTGRGPNGEGTTLGLRTMALREDSAVDVTVSLKSVADRLARKDAAGLRLSVPPVRISPPWAALDPPRAGWQPVGTIPVDTVRDAADRGIADVAKGAPPGSRELAVDALRRIIWGRPMDGPVEGLPSSMAFAAQTLGFLVGQDAQVHRGGDWWRLTTRAGFVLAR